MIYKMANTSMNPQNLEIFLTWLDNELNLRNWNDHQLCLKAGISNSVISKARAGLRPIGWDACVAIASALDYPAETVFKRAGLLPSEDEKSIIDKQIIHIVQQLDSEDQNELLEIARLKLEKQDRNRKNRRSSALSDAG